MIQSGNGKTGWRRARNVQWKLQRQFLFRRLFVVSHIERKECPRSSEQILLHHMARDLPNAWQNFFFPLLLIWRRGELWLIPFQCFSHDIYMMWLCSNCQRWREACRYINTLGYGSSTNYCWSMGNLLFLLLMMILSTQSFLSLAILKWSCLHLPPR